MESIDGEWQGRSIAKKDAKKYKAGKMTKEEIHNACEYARLCAAYGDALAQEIGYYYLKQMEEEKIIKNLHVED